MQFALMQLLADFKLLNRLFKLLKFHGNQLSLKQTIAKIPNHSGDIKIFLIGCYEVLGVSKS